MNFKISLIDNPLQWVYDGLISHTAVQNYWEEHQLDHLHQESIKKFDETRDF